MGIIHNVDNSHQILVCIICIMLNWFVYPGNTKSGYHNIYLDGCVEIGIKTREDESEGLSTDHFSKMPLGFDCSVPVNVDAFRILKDEHGYRLFIGRVWMETNNFDEEGIQNVKNAREGKLAVLLSNLKG
jgi:hypothetical protein